MYGLKRNNILIMTFMFYGASLAAQNHLDVQDSVRIYFKQGKIDFVPTLRENQSALNRIADTMRITLRRLCLSVAKDPRSGRCLTRGKREIQPMAVREKSKGIVRLSLPLW